MTKEGYQNLKELSNDSTPLSVFLMFHSQWSLNGMDKLQVSYKGSS